MMVFCRLQFRLAVIAVAGCLLAFYILQTTGFQPILRAANTVGWRGFLVLCLYQFGLFVLLGTAWFVLTPVARGARLSVFVWARMVRDAASDLLPFSHLGGIVLGARSAIGRGVTQSVVFGSMATDITAEMLGQIAFTLVGIVILTASVPQDRVVLSLTGSAVLGLLCLFAVCAAFAALQRYGSAISRKLISRLFPGAIPVTESTIGYIQQLYRRPSVLVLSVVLHFSGWVASAVSTWIALFLMGVHPRASDVLAIESLVCAARSVGFWVPNGLGIQEVAFAAIMPLFGIGAEIGLAVSILKRARDIAVGAPVLLIWQFFETQRSLQIDGGAAQQRVR
jgi:putative membrane protein